MCTHIHTYTHTHTHIHPQTFELWRIVPRSPARVSVVARVLAITHPSFLWHGYVTDTGTVTGTVTDMNYATPRPTNAPGYLLHTRTSAARSEVAISSVLSVCAHVNPSLAAPTVLSPTPRPLSLLAPGERPPPPNADAAQLEDARDAVDLAELGAEAASSGLCLRGETRDMAGWGMSGWRAGFGVWGSRQRSRRGRGV